MAWESFGKFVAGLIATIIGAIYGGFVASYLWAWLIAPTFHMPVLTVGQAVGLTFFLGVYTRGWSTKDDDKSYGEKLCESFILITCVWAFGFALSYFV